MCKVLFLNVMNNNETPAFPLYTAGIAALLMQCILAVPASAQSLDYGAFESLFEEPVTASVTGSPQRASEVPATMEIITAARIRRSGARDIPGVLRQVTGMNVTRWTNNGADVSIRGYNAAFNPRLLVMINGRQVYADHYGYVPWSTLPVTLAEIRQIEVVKGPNSALFGFNAVGGVINIITYNPFHDDIDAVTLRAGTQDLVEGEAAMTLNPSPETGIRVSLRGRENDDFSTPLPLASEGIRFGDTRRSGRIDLHYQPLSDLQFELEGTWSRAEQNNMGPNYGLAFEETTVRSLKGSVTADTDFGLIEASAYQNQIENDVFAPNFLDGSNTISPDIPILTFDNEVTFLKLQDIIKPAPAHTLRFSGEYRDSSLNTTPVAGGEVSYEVLSAGGMWQWQVTDSLTLTGAVRHDRLDLQREGFFPEGLLLTNADWDRRLSENSFNLGLVWQIDANNTLRLVGARGVQLPSLFNLGGSLFRFDIPSETGPPVVFYLAGVPTLSPTTVDNAELAWKRDFPALDMAFRLALFRGESRDVIADAGDTDPAIGISSSPANIGDSDTTGIEVSLQGNVGETWRWELGYVHQKIDDDFGDQYPTTVTTRNFEETTPEHSVNANLGWARGPWEIDTYLRYESSVQNLRAALDFFNPQVLFPVDDFVILDARVGYRFSDRVGLELAGQNLLKSEQVQHTGPAVERKVNLGLQVTW